MSDSRRSRRDRMRRLVVAVTSPAGLVLAMPALADPPSASQSASGEPPARVERHAPVEVVVKFRDDSKVQAIVDAFWTDAAKARADFDTFKRGRAEFRETFLIRVTYSSELVLAFPASSASNSREAARELLSRLRAAPDIAYAELDHTVSTQGP